MHSRRRRWCPCQSSQRSFQPLPYSFRSVFPWIFSCRRKRSCFFRKGKYTCRCSYKASCYMATAKEKTNNNTIRFAHNLPFQFLSYRLSLHGIVDGATKHESLMLFLAGRTQHLFDNNCYFKCPETSKKRIEFLAPLPINVQLRIRNLLFLSFD